MLALDGKCTLEEFNLLEIMLAGRAVTEVMKLLYPAGSATAVTKATVVIASLEGDVHDLGKNILKMVLTGSRYRVVDCGKDCPLPKLMEAVEKEQPVGHRDQRPHHPYHSAGETGEGPAEASRSGAGEGHGGGRGLEAIFSR